IRKTSRRIDLLRNNSNCNSSIEHMIGVTPKGGFKDQKLFSLYKVISIAFLVIGNAMLLPSLFVETSAQQTNTADFEVTHGIASGDVTNQSAIIWSRVNDQPAQMNVEYDTDANFTNPLRKTTQADSTTDFTAHAKLDGLRPDTQYYYRVWFTGSDIENNNNTISNNNISTTSDNAELVEIGTFRTAPSRDMTSNSGDISFVWSADIGGQNFCRNANEGGYSIFKSMQSLDPDFFIANGDMIYADGACPAQGPTFLNNTDNQTITWTNIPGDFKSIADPSVDWNNVTEVRSIFLDHWKYNRNDTYFKEFLSNVSMYSQWDDHEIINDFGSKWPYWNLFSVDREGYPNIVNEGRNAFLYYSPLDSSDSNNNYTQNDREKHIYRSFNWGKDLDLFIIDARSYRSQNHIADTPESNKTMLGQEQLQWLKEELSNSNATWKAISSDVPISIPTGSNTSILGRDGWANGNETNNYSYYTGFESELTDLLRFIDNQQIKNVVFVTTDVHFPAFIKYDFDLNNDGTITEIHELVSGPLSAFRLGVPFPKLDETFNPSLLYGEGNIFNFGYIRIEDGRDDDGDDNGRPHLIADIRDQNGIVRAGSTLDLRPR
ncbi:MAG TPA: alkaline phosphatase D family protein, partial [Nitrososphaera sp.]|nr:alkaline phosphatase D family protein [Nitrososphaera sp.]